ncbi:MAG: hypothetical protein ABW019_13575, partial [Chitinophagaceae bacterium]
SGRLTGYSFKKVYFLQGETQFYTTKSSYVYTSYGMNFTTEEEYYSSPVSPVDFRSRISGKVYNTTVNNCITQQADSISFANFYRNSGAMIDSVCYKIITDFRYDDRPNPFWRTYRVFSPLAYDTDVIEEWGQPHNLISINVYVEPYWSTMGTVVIGGGGGSYGWSNSYEYKPNGYPQVKREFDRYAAGDVSKTAFIYGK